MLKLKLRQLNFGLGLALALGGLNAPAFAQPVTGNEGYTSNEKDSLYGDSPGGINPLDLMHRSQQLNRRSATEFNQESEVQLNDSVSDFKRLQQQRILEQQSQDAPESLEIPETK